MEKSESEHRLGHSADERRNMKEKSGGLNESCDIIIEDFVLEASQS